MGCTQSSNMLPPNVSIQTINKLLIISDVNHQLNVNNKYEYLSKIDQSKTVGEGLRKTFAYRCLTTKQQLIAKRKQFWETRSSSQREYWKALENAVDSISNDQAKKYLSKAKITALNGSIQMCIDNRGNRFQLPVFVINKPLSFDEHKIAEQHLIDIFKKSALKLKIRSAKFLNEDLTLDATTSTLIKEIKSRIVSQKSLGKCSIRMFYNGKELLDDKAIGNYGYIEQTILQAMVKQ